MNTKRGNLYISQKQKHEAYISKDYRWERKNDEIILINTRTNRECDPDDINVKISIYENRVIGWFLDQADLLKQYGHTGFVILQIGVSYIEGNQQFREGKTSKKQSKGFFIKGMRRIFNKEHVSKQVLSDFYEQVRCGLFHDGMTKEKVLISCDFVEPISIHHDVIYIHPHWFLDKVKEDFHKYILDLKNSKNKAMRANFEKMFYFGKGRLSN